MCESLSFLLLKKSITSLWVKGYGSETQLVHLTVKNRHFWGSLPGMINTMHQKAADGPFSGVKMCNLTARAKRKLRRWLKLELGLAQRFQKTGLQACTRLLEWRKCTF